MSVFSQLAEVLICVVCVPFGVSSGDCVQGNVQGVCAQWGVSTPPDLEADTPLL